MVRKLFIAPGSEPGATVERCLKIPASQEWLAVVNAALLLMTNEYNYEQLNETDLTPEDCARIAYLMYIEYLKGDCSVVDCNTLLECLPELTDAFKETGSLGANSVNPDSTETLNTRLDTIARNQPVSDAPAGCDLDILWAGCFEIASRIDSYGLDMLERIVAETDLIERVATAIEIIPVLGDIGAAILNTLVNEAVNLRDAYTAHTSLSVVEEIACDLFQMGCELCRYPTFKEIMDYYNALGATSAEDFFNLSANAVFDYLAQSSGSTNLLVYFTTNVAQLWIRAAGGTWINQAGLDFITRWAKLGEDNPSNDWQLLCGPCGEPGPWEVHYMNGTFNWDASKFTIAQEWAPCDASYDPVNDRINGCCPGAGQSVSATIYGQTARYTRVKLRVDVNKTRSGTDIPCRVQIGTTIIFDSSKTTLSAQTYFVDWTGDLTGQLKITGLARNNNCADAAYWRMLYLDLYGEDTNPYA